MLKDKLCSLRKLHGFTQEQIADHLGVSRQAYSKWENGRALPDLFNTIALAELYQISLDDLLQRKETNTRPIPDEALSGKHIFGTLTLSERGQLVIPKQAREIFHLRPGDKLILLGDEKEGLALVREEVFLDRMNEALELSRYNPQG